MTDVYFGRTVPIHHSMLSLAGWSAESRESMIIQDEETRLVEMRLGREELVKQTKVDFGYDLAAWRELLLTFDEFGYRHPYAFDGVDQEIQNAINDPGFQRLRAIAETRLREHGQ